MDAESVRSGRSEPRSERSRRSRGHRHGRHRSRERSNERDDRSVTIQLPGDSGGENVEDDRIEVQILPQDDNWGDNTTAITGATSETGISMEDVSRIEKDMDDSMGFDCARYIGSVLAAILGFLAFVSPIVMVLLPKLNIDGWETVPCEASCIVDTKTDTGSNCEPKCEGLLISLAFKLLILLIGTWALFFRKPKATMPRIFIFRAAILFLVFVLTFAFWLFYAVRILQKKEKDYYSIISFAVSLADSLLFIHYLSIILLEIRQMQPMYVVRVVRSPDGESRSYNIGQLSIQRAAVTILEQYYKDFPVYNPYLDSIPGSSRRKNLTNFKFYDVDGVTHQTPHGRSRAIFAAAAHRRDRSHNDRFYEEQEYERRLRKRRARLIVAADEAFTHIRRLHEEQGPAIPMDPQEAAQAIFPSMARALQKYLRVTRQQPRYSMENILEHLAACLSHDMSPRSFIERYMSQGNVIHNDRDHRPTQTWVLICDTLLSRAVEDGTLFQLRQGDIAILCSVRKIPHFNITEEVINPKDNKFVLRLNSETSV
uniref:Vang-like protein n=1 Tax=Terebratalia transversa TaxID=34513 RepID=A0A0F6N0Q3_TERTR|nr:str [Terebratalia transversa]